MEAMMSTTEIRNALNIAVDTLSAHPEKARTRPAPLTARLLEKLRCRVTGTSGETILTDMPPALGGDGTAPSPGWYLRAALAACTATVIAMRAARLDVALTTLEVTVESEADQRGLLGLDERVSAGVAVLRTRVRIGATNADAEQLRALVQWGDTHSPVACTVRHAPACTLEVEIV
jgi:uncharacterized OsmC-like protein